MRLRPHTLIVLWSWFVLASVTAPSTVTGASSGADVRQALAQALADFRADDVPTGILYDRAVGLSGIGRFDGTPKAPAADRGVWQQMLFEIRTAAFDPAPWPSPLAWTEREISSAEAFVVPIAVLNVAYDRIDPAALQDGTLRMENGRLAWPGRDPRALREQRVFAATALRERSYRGTAQSFVLEREAYLTNDDRAVRRVEADFDDGHGWRDIQFGAPVEVAYPQVGEKRIHLRVSLEDGTRLEAALRFDVVALATPTPDDTLHVTGTIPYDGEFASGDAYVYRAEGHATLVNPIVAIEGFDIDNSLNWDGIYAVLNQENLVETLRGMGFDIVALNFTDSTDYLQKNAFLIVELIQQVQSALDPAATFPLVGASMGGLGSRYALTYMENQGISSRVRNFISFDAPHAGADIPLGIQYWLDFFAGLSTDASYLLGRLDTPAARQMLLYHHTTPPGTTGESDPLRADFLADLAGLGDYPTGVRMVAVTNGSGTQMDQGYAAGDQIIQYVYDSTFVDITGNVWAVPDGGSQMIFDGQIYIFLIQNETMSVTVDATLPYDNGPGGYRASMAQMDSVQAPYGDIVALHDNHAFIPTISALALDNTVDPFYDVVGDPDLLMHTPFDAVYVSSENQPHVTVTPEIATWLIDEILRSPTAVLPGELPSVARRPVLYQNTPNPFNPRTTIRFRLGATGPVTLDVFDVRGRRIERLVEGVHDPGLYEIVWPSGGANVAGPATTGGRDGSRSSLASGVYFYRLTTAGESIVKKMVLVE